MTMLTLIPLVTVAIGVAAISAMIIIITTTTTMPLAAAQFSEPLYSRGAVRTPLFSTS
jgi:hypothetical protein